ncbi:MAG: hypothetical protein ACR2G3_08490 [Solirubrobacterales bacterium]
MVGNVEQVSVVAAPAGDVWERAITEEGINHELGPWLRMTMPPGLRGSTIDDVEVGVPLGRSWLLALRLVPVDYDDLCLAELEPGRRFLERSTMLSMRLWQHERIVEPQGPDSAIVTDRLAFELRRLPAAIPGSARFASWLVGRIFAHRHRRLAGWATGRSLRAAARPAGT